MDERPDEDDATLGIVFATAGMGLAAARPDLADARALAAARRRHLIHAG